MLAEQTQSFNTGFESSLQPKAVILLTCPTTGKLVEAKEWKYVLLRTEAAMWWRCTECHGWHIALPVK